MAVRRWKPNKIRCRTTLDVVEIGHDMDMGMNMDMEHGVGMWVRCELYPTVSYEIRCGSHTLRVSLGGGP